MIDFNNLSNYSANLSKNDVFFFMSFSSSPVTPADCPNVATVSDNDFIADQIIFILSIVLSEASSMFTVFNSLAFRMLSPSLQEFSLFAFLDPALFLCLLMTLTYLFFYRFIERYTLFKIIQLPQGLKIGIMETSSLVFF